MTAGPATIREYDAQAGRCGPAVGGLVTGPSTSVLHENSGGEVVRPVRDLKERLDARVEGREVVVKVVVGPEGPTAPDLARVLATPPPWRKEWLERHGLRVRYAHGRATLEVKK